MTAHESPWSPWKGFKSLSHSNWSQLKTSVWSVTIIKSAEELKKNKTFRFGDNYETWPQICPIFSWRPGSRIFLLRLPVLEFTSPAQFFFSPKLSRYLANPSHCQDLNAAFSVCHIFGIRHSASFPWARQTRREREEKGERSWRGDKETHSMDYTGTYT